MQSLTEQDFDVLQCCPWDGNDSENAELLYVDSMGCEIVKCSTCGVVYAKKRLNNSGLQKFWYDYLTRVHVHDEVKVKQREKMYKIDYEYIHKFVPKGNVLDVGCGNGSFMRFFERDGYTVEGVEFGQEAAEVARKEHKVYYGDFLKINFPKKYNLIVFRGVLQYVPDVKKYLQKAISIISNESSRGGHVFITAQPNINSLCFRLFKENFILPITGADFLGLSEGVLSEYFAEYNFRKVGEEYFYENTPYANTEDDILLVAKAILCKREGRKIDFLSPPFWGNMMSLVYKRQ